MPVIVPAMWRLPPFVDGVTWLRSRLRHDGWRQRDIMPVCLLRTSPGSSLVDCVLSLHCRVTRLGFLVDFLAGYAIGSRRVLGHITADHVAVFFFSWTLHDASGGVRGGGLGRSKPCSGLWSRLLVQRVQHPYIAIPRSAVALIAG